MDWMGQLPIETQLKPINQIILPGSHDSGAYTLNLIKCNSKPVLRAVAWLGTKNTRVKNIIQKWTLTHQDKIYKQLVNGIRVLDLRISSISSSEFCVSHTFGCTGLESVLTQINEFVVAHPTEIVILQCCPDYANRLQMTPTDHSNVLACFKSVFGTKLASVTQTFPSYKDLIENKTQILVFYTPFQSGLNFVWSDSLMTDPWTNTSTLSVKQAELRLDIANLVNHQTKYNNITFTLTPQLGDLIKGFFVERSLYQLSSTIRSTLPNFLELHSGNLDHLSCIKFDFPSTQDIIEVINLNYEKCPFGSNKV